MNLLLIILMTVISTEHPRTNGSSYSVAMNERSELRITPHPDGSWRFVEWDFVEAAVDEDLNIRITPEKITVYKEGRSESHDLSEILVVKKPEQTFTVKGKKFTYQVEKKSITIHGLGKRELVIDIQP